MIETPTHQFTRFLSLSLDMSLSNKFMVLNSGFWNIISAIFDCFLFCTPGKRKGINWYWTFTSCQTQSKCSYMYCLPQGSKAGYIKPTSQLNKLDFGWSCHLPKATHLLKTKLGFEPNWLFNPKVLFFPLNHTTLKLLVSSFIQPKKKKNLTNIFCGSGP